MEVNIYSVYYTPIYVCVCIQAAANIRPLSGTCKHIPLQTSKACAPSRGYPPTHTHIQYGIGPPRRKTTRGERGSEGHRLAFKSSANGWRARSTATAIYSTRRVTYVPAAPTSLRVFQNAMLADRFSKLQKLYFYASCMYYHYNIVLQKC